jgi:adenine-specific DNA-methyltransferase
MLIIYKVDAIESIVEEIKKMPADTFIKVYVFSTNNYAMDADFEEVSDKVFLCALPAAIYNAYKKVLPRKNNVITEEEEE